MRERNLTPEYCKPSKGGVDGRKRKVERQKRQSAEVQKGLIKERLQN